MINNSRKSDKSMIEMKRREVDSNRTKNIFF